MELGGWSYMLDHAVAGKEPRVFQLAALPVHGDDDVGILRKQCRHADLLKAFPSRGSAVDIPPALIDCKGYT